MEQAIFVKHPSSYREETKLIYRGAEACLYQMPSLEEIAHLSEVDLAGGCRTVWTLPLIRNRDLEKAQRLIKRMMERPEKPCFVFNDIGLLAWFSLNYPGISVLCGRFLSHLFSNGPEDILDSLGICRLEFDDIDELQKYGGALPRSFHLPFRRMSVMSECSFRPGTDGEQSCSHLCQDSLLLNRPAGCPSLLVQGNAIYAMPYIPDVDWMSLGVDRLIWHSR